MQLDSNTPTGIIQIVLFAVLVWGSGIGLSGWYFYKFIKAMKGRTFTFAMPPTRFWVWLVGISIFGTTGFAIPQLVPALYPYPILCFVLPSLAIAFFGLVFNLIRPFPKPEWLLVALYACPGVIFEVLRREITHENA
jgi:hypothetical protein